MNETLWRTETNPIALLEALHPMRTLGSVQPQTRQSRMYLLACARRSWHRLPNVCRTLVGLAEVYADAPRKEGWLRAQVAPIAEQLMNSEGEPDDLLAAHVALVLFAEHISVDLQEAHREAAKPPDPLDLPLSPEEWRGLSALVYLPFEPNTPTFRWVPRPLHSRRLLHEVYGKPYRRVRFSPEWRTSDVLALARQMYKSREFSAMPILADALQDAGCDDADVLLHCRHPAEHVRGCWVLDLVLDLK